MTAVYSIPAFTTRSQSDTEPSIVANKPTALANSHSEPSALANKVTISILRSQINLK